MENNLNKYLFNSQDNNKREVSKEKGKKKKFDFNQKRKNTIKSLSEVENFLRDFKKISKYIQLYKIMK